MADKVSLEVEVGGVEQSINSVKDLKTALKAAKDEQLKAAAAFGEGSKQYVSATKKVGELRDKVDDLADSTRGLQGSGIERASTGFSQLGEGLKNLDFDKVKIGLTAIKSALASTGIMLVVQGVTYLIENFEELSKGSGIVAQALQFVGNYLTKLKDAIYAVTDALGLTNSELDKQGEKLKTNADKATESLSRQTAEYDRQIAIAKASGESAVDLEIAKQKAIIETNKALVQQTIEYVRNGGVLNEEQKKLLTGQLEAIKGAVNQENIITIEGNKQKKEDYKKHQEDLNKIGEENFKRYQEFLKAQKEAQAAIDAEEDESEKLRLIDQAKADSDAYYKGKREADLLNYSLNNAEFDKIQAEKNAKEIAEHKKVEEAKRDISLDLANKSITATQNITDAFFAYKLSSVKKGSAEELKIAKQQFEVNKKLQLAQATIQGIQSVLAAFSSGSAIPIIGAVAGPAYAVLAGIAAAANIAKIASTKFEGGGGGGSITPSSSSAAISVPAPPTINTPSANTNQSTTFDNNGKRLGGNAERQSQTININANIGIDEVNKKQQRVNVLEKQSTF